MLNTVCFGYVPSQVVSAARTAATAPVRFGNTKTLTERYDAAWKAYEKAVGSGHSINEYQLESTGIKNNEGGMGVFMVLDKGG